MAKAAYFETFSAIAKHCGVNETAFARWRRFNGGFPPKTKNGYNANRVEAWLKKHALGKYSKRATNGHGDGTLTAARIKLTEQKLRTEEAEATRKEIETAKLLGQVLLVDDVAAWHRKIARVIVTTLDALPDAVDRALPASLTEEERQRVMTNVRRIANSVLSAVQNFMGSGEGDAK